mgnify:CR=1 FL=1
MIKLVRWPLMALCAYGVWRFVQAQAERDGGLGATLEHARARVEAAVAEGRRAAEATRAQLEAQAGRALRPLDDEPDEDDDLAAAPWPQAPAATGRPV